MTVPAGLQAQVRPDALAGVARVREPQNPAPIFRQGEAQAPVFPAMWRRTRDNGRTAALVDVATQAGRYGAKIRC